MTQTTKIFSSPEAIRSGVDDALTTSLANVFPIEDKNYVLSASDIQAHPKTISSQDEKQAYMDSKSLTYPITGTLTLTSKATGKVLDTVRDFTLMDAFYVTNKHTLLYKGNNYIISNLLRLKPGVYVRTSDRDGHLEAHFNTKRGASFKIILEPQSGVFFMETSGGAKIPLAPLLTHVFGVSSSQVERYIPAPIWEANLKETAGSEDKVVNRFYDRLVYTKDASLPTDKKAEALKQTLTKGTLDPVTTQATLGKALSGVEAETLLLTLKKLVDVYKGDAPEDNRDSLQFKKVSNFPDFLRDRFEKNHETVQAVRKKLKFSLERLDPNNPKIRDVVSSKPFNKVLTSYIQNSSLVSTPSETNPLESLENVGKVTVLGAEEGGIGDERAVPLAARNIDLSHIGILDPSRTPESGHAGIDLRFTVAARRDKEGNLYTEVENKAGKKEIVSVATLMRSNVGFRGSEKDGYVQAKAGGELKRIPVSSVDYWVDDPNNLYTVTTNLVPFLNSNHPGRLTMAGKALPQALSLVNREAPLVQTQRGKTDTFVNFFGRLLSTAAPEDGVVTKVTPGSVTIKGDSGATHVVKAVKNLPFNQKGFFDDETPLVKVGDRVKSEASIDAKDSPTPLFDNNYTKNGAMALGKNLRVAYMPWKGYNHEDAIVIRQGAADSLQSHHAYKFEYEVNPDSTQKKGLFRRYFPSKYTIEQLNKLDDDGYAKEGVTLEKGDPVIAVLEKRTPSPEERMLGQLHKILVSPYKAVVEEWEHDEPGQVVSTSTKTPNKKVLVRSIKSLEVGDKLTGQHGNKGVISLIVPDNEMPYDKVSGEPVDLILNPASVTSRINLGQIHETIAGKIAKKLGKPYIVKNFGNENNVAKLKEEMKQHGVSDTDELVDPKTGKSFGPIFNGHQYVLKLFKTTDQNLSARNVGGYDANEQPTKGGSEGAKAEGYMETLALVGSNARHNLKEAATVKSEKNENFWDKFQTGQPVPRPAMTFATKKFFDMLKAAGVAVRMQNGMLSAAPIKDSEILQMSNGEVEKPTMLNSKNLEPEKGGLFDIRTTGGLKGERWTHYKLAEPVVNPVAERAVKAVLGLSSDEFNGLVDGTLGVKGTTLVNTKTGQTVRELKLNS